MEKFTYWQEHITAWMQEHVLTLPILTQLGVMAGILLFSSVLHHRPRRRMDNFFKRRFSATSLQKYNEEALVNLSYPLTAWVLAWASVGIFSIIGWPTALLEVMGKLLTAWICIRLFTSLVRSHAWSKFIAVSAWIIAALSITELLDPTMAFLDGMAITLGEYRLSALGVVKGIATLIVLLWLAGAGSRVSEQRIQKLHHINPSVRVLLSKAVKIFLIAIAILISANSFGIDLTALTVFGGAVGLGIGFGLQKVVSNLMSGVILLLDRSVKPGDVIEVEGTYGWVNSLGARYVSVLTRDGVEHLIPNELLITEKVVNWSYSNPQVRLKIPVGVSYDADVEQAMEFMLEAAQNHDRVLKNPAPVSRLVGFGDSAIDLELRIWINDPNKGVVNVRSDILLNIWKAFKEHEIGIPYPQRDVHVRIPEGFTLSKT